MSVSSTNSNGNAAGRASAYLGFVLFLIGMAMVAYVFMEANRMLGTTSTPVPTISGTNNPNAATDAALQLGGSAMDLAKKLLILLVMCIVGSVFASKGIQLLFAAWNAAPAHQPSPQTPPIP